MFKIGDKKFSLPSGWGQVPYWKAEKLIRDNPSPVAALALLADVDVKDLRKSKDVHFLFDTLTFINKLPEDGFPASVVYEHERYPLPWVNLSDEFDLGECEVGQVEDMQLIISQKVKEFMGEEERSLTDLEAIEIIPYIVAIYIQKVVDGSYDGKKSQKIVDKVKEMSFADVYTM